MALRGKKVEAVTKRLKMFLYGNAGVGKTTAAISFPAPYFIDCERGGENSQYLELLDKNKGVIFQSSDFSEIIKEVKALLSERHEYKTLIIDPLTVVYNNLVEQHSVGKDATAYGKHYAEANKAIKQLLQLLLRLDMNVIITSHAKNEYGKDMAVIGTTFDCFKKLDYLFDLVIEIRKLGLKRIGMVRKTRVKTFDEAEEFDFSYDVIAEKYGRDVIEKTSEAKQLATEAQIKEMFRLVDLLQVPMETQMKWLNASHSHTFSDMDTEVIDKYIDYLTKKTQGV